MTSGKTPEYYESLEGSSIKCLLCANACVLSEGGTGLCGVNGNLKGELRCYVYGRPAALHVDPVEKKPLLRFLPGTGTFSVGTFGCNLKCPWCQNYHISCAGKTQADNLRYTSPEEVVEEALRTVCMSVSYTYNEPTVFYPYARDIGMLAASKGLKNIFVTNGYQSGTVIRDIVSWADAANVDLKCFDPVKYKEYTGADLETVMNNLRIMAESDMHLEITTLIIPDFNDSEQELSSIAEFIADELGTDVVWHVSAFFPYHKMTDRPPASREKVFNAVDIGFSKGLKYVRAGNV